MEISNGESEEKTVYSRHIFTLLYEFRVCFSDFYLVSVEFRVKVRVFYKPVWIQCLGNQRLLETLLCTHSFLVQ